MVESWANSALSWLQGLAEDEEEWNRTMGTTPDFFQKPLEEESGLLCAYSYFQIHTLYVLEWYYDYIGYDYYHQDFNFYYYDDTLYHYYYYDDYSGSGSGSGSGDYFYEDYSGSGSGDYYLGSGSGKKSIRLENILVIISRIWDD